MSEGTLPSDSAAVLAAYRALVRRRRLVIAGLCCIVLACFLADMASGPAMLSPLEVVKALMGEDVARGVRTIVLAIRLPAALVAVLTGASLSLAGAEMQTLLDNPMASPFTLGLSAAATFGAALAIVLGLSLPGIPGPWLVFANAFLFALLSALLLQALSSFYQQEGASAVLFGIALLFAFNAAVALMQFIANEQALQQLVFWTLGSLDRADGMKLTLLAAIFASVSLWSLSCAPSMNLLRLGTERAVSLGVDLGHFSLFSLIRVSLLTGVSVAIVGVIGFIGLVGPHMARLLVGEDHRFFLPTAMLCGAAIMSLASIASKTLVPGVIVPVGVVTALIGVPLFMVLIHRQQRRG